MARLSVEERRAQLLEVGRMVFAERAYDAISIDDLAARAGVSKGLLYHYFKDKKGFYRAVLSVVAAEVRAVSHPLQNGEFLDRVRGGLERFHDYVASNEAHYRALIRGGIGTDDVIDQLVEDVRRSTLDHVGDALGTELTPPQRVVVYGWVGMVEFSTLAWLENPAMERDRLHEILMLSLGRLLS